MMPKIAIIAWVTAAAFCLICLMGAAAVRAGQTVVEIKDLKIGDMVVQGFELSQKGDVRISAVGAGAKHSQGLFAYGWIINAADRELVWTMNEDCEDLSRLSNTLIECDEDVALPAGRYEVYYYAGSPRNFLFGGISVNDLGDLVNLLGDIFQYDEEDSIRFYDEDVEELTMRVISDIPARAYMPVFGKPAGAVVYINQPERDEFRRQGFTLKTETDLQVYAIGEFSDSYDLFVDGGWIINADSRKKVWVMDKWNTEWAGGADKNRYVQDIVTLPAGNYVACYASDDSHDPGEWNSPPPADPMNYGMTITTVRAADAANISAYDDTLNEVEIVRLVRVRNDSFKKAGFTLKRDAKIRILALGERNYSGNELVDYGWITDVDNGEKVWEMTGDNTDFAGGAAKNCRFDGLIDLPPGNYMVYYRTDDSHAYGDWNAAAPFDKSNWGISLFGVGKDFSAGSFAAVEDFPPSGKVLVDLTGLGDDADVSKTFSLSQESAIKITALGEGRKGEMFDYGWIEDAETGETVWEMTFRKTRHAGGADKNRQATATITLEKGKYRVFFVTDDSHSFEDFNASPPDDPERWGILISEK